MPTGARLVAAIVFAIFAYLGGMVVHGILEAEAGYDLPIGWLREVMAAIGVLCGWVIMGKRVGEGTKFAISSGLLTAVAVVFWGLLAFSLREMLIESTKMSYHGATQAIIDTFRIALEHGETIAKPSLIFLVLIGGVVGGYAAEWANRRYR